jgi:hypothetical protein
MNEDLATGPSTPTRALRAKLLSLGELPLAALVVGALIFAAYGGLFDAWFHPIDDALHLVGVQQGKYPLTHPRPAHFAWNRALFALFGTKATAWHAAGLALHATAACALFVLARSTGAPRVAALAGASVFAVLHAPLSAVAWISAVSGLLVVVFSLLSGLCWWMHLEASAPRARWAWYAVALLALVGAAASKQDCVIVGPLLFGLHVLRDGWREVLKPRALLRYAPFALVGAIYLVIAFDPTLWSSRPGVGEYRFSFELVPRAHQLDGARLAATHLVRRGADVDVAGGSRTLRRDDQPRAHGSRALATHHLARLDARAVRLVTGLAGSVGGRRGFATRLHERDRNRVDRRGRGRRRAEIRAACVARRDTARHRNRLRRARVVRALDRRLALRRGEP